MSFETYVGLLYQNFYCFDSKKIEDFQRMCMKTCKIKTLKAVTNKQLDVTKHTPYEN